VRNLFRLSDKTFRYHSGARNRKMTIIDKVGIFAFFKRALIDIVADVGAEKTVFFTHLERLRTARV
jgi:hypothetical protein